MCAGLPKRYALLVGIDLYLNDGSRNSSNNNELSLHHLRGCTNDIHAINNFLRDDYEFENISILTSSFPASNGEEGAAVQPVEHRERLPTFANIKAEFDAIHEQAAPGDFFFFHYSGHGALLPRLRESPRNNLSDPSLVTVDFCCGQPALRGWQLNQWLKKLNDKGVQVVVTLDSCYSGGSWRSTDDYMSFRMPMQWSLVPNLAIDGQVIANAGEPVQFVRRGAKLETSWSINPDSFTLMAACGIEERAAEKVVNGKTYGAFTWELLDYLRGVKDKFVTYRMISDQLKMRLKGQTPEAYGRDKLLFFGSHEPFLATPLIVQLEGNNAIIPVGRAHGVDKGSEFMISSELLNATFPVDEVDELQCSGIISDDFSLLLKEFHHCVISSRWSLGEKEPLRIHVDLAFDLEFRGQLQKQLEERIVGSIELLESAEDNVLKLSKLGEDDATIRGPAWLTGSDNPVRPLNLRYSNINELVAEAALALSHLARYRQILLLGDQRSSNLPFAVSIQPINGNVANPHPLNQKFKFTFQSKSDGELYITVIVFSPEFSIEQLYPSRDYPQTINKRQKKSFNFTMTLPNGPQWVQESRCRTFRRDIVRTLVTTGMRTSWKSLELPNIWDTSIMASRKGQLSLRGSSAASGSEVEWWSHDEEIFTGSTEIV
ncbi:caspase domain-containing protein [Trichoderma sp. SZMC 28011]